MNGTTKNRKKGSVGGSHVERFGVRPDTSGGFYRRMPLPAETAIREAETKHCHLCGVPALYRSVVKVNGQLQGVGACGLHRGALPEHYSTQKPNA